MNPYILITTAAILEHLVLAWDIKADFKFWKKEKSVNHNNQGFKRLILLSPSFIMYAIPINWWAVVISFLMVCFRYWLLFDGLYSNKRRFNFWHLGSDGPEDGVLDNFLQSLTKWQHIAIKLGGAIIFTAAYIIILIQFL